MTYIQEGDLLPTTHRIVLYEGENGYITKGDFNNTTDFDVVYQSEIVGEYLFKIPKLGFVLEWFTTIEGIIYTIIFIVILYGVIFLWRRKESDEEENEEEIIDEIQNDDNQE